MAICLRCKNECKRPTRGLCYGCYDKYRNDYPRLVPWKPWTRKELGRVVELRKQGIPWAAIARLVGHPEGALKKTLKHHRISIPKLPKKDIPYDVIRRLHGLGYTDPEIARVLNVSNSAVKVRRRQMGLPSNRFSARGFRRVRKGHKRRLENEGYDSLVELRWDKDRIETLANGWPPGITSRQARYLEVLKEMESASVVVIAKELGYKEIPTQQAMRKLELQGLVRYSVHDGIRQYSLSEKCLNPGKLNQGGRVLSTKYLEKNHEVLQ